MTIAHAARVRPDDAAELARVLRESDQQQLAVIPTGAGTKQYLGNPPSRVDVVLETGALSGIVEHNPADLTITARAGTPLRALQAHLGASSQRLALDPPHADAATIGGVVATNASGPRRAKYGTVRDLLIGTRIALVDGTIARSGGKVVKNVAGYDLNKLYIGSLGTLGVIVEATFKVLPIPEHEAGIAARFPSLRAACAAAVALAHTSLRPSAIEADDLDGTPRLVVVADGHRPAVSRVLGDASSVMREHGATEVEPVGDVDDALSATRRIVESAAGATLRVSLPIAAEPAFVAETRRIANDRAVAIGIAAHASSGIVRAQLNGEREQLRQAALEIVALAKTLDGDAWCERVAENSRAAIEDAWFGEPPGFFLMKRIKEEFDPRRTLNPGRFVGGL